MSKIKKMIPVILIAVPLIIAIAIYPFLPERIPIHWDSSFKPDSYGGKYFIFILAVVPFVLYSGIKRRYFK